MAREGKVWRAGHRLGGGVGGETVTEAEDQISNGPVVDLEPNVQTMKVWSKDEGHLYGHKIKQCI